MLRKIRLALMPLAFYVYKIIYWLFNFLPVKDKIVATTMRGRKYSDNPRFIIEKLHELHPDLDIVWFVDDRYDYDVPSWVRAVPYYRFGMLKRIYEMVTARVWINSHLFEHFVRKKENQLFIETDHGSIPLKKVHLDVNPIVKKNSNTYKELIQTAKNADVFLSDSDFHQDFFKRAYAFNGPIYKSGFPRNDELVIPTKDYRKIVKENLHLGECNIFLYAPTFREKFEKTHEVDYKVYNVDYENIYKILCSTFGGDWMILVKYHPTMQLYVKENLFSGFSYVKDVTDYSNMQELISASDFVLTDYSSSIIDAGIAGVPGLTLCLDYEDYKKERDVYFEMESLPFPFARTNEELIDNLRHFQLDIYMQKWEKFALGIGLHEPGNASEVVSKKILDYLNNKTIKWNN